jgi:hypothetical protein
LDAPALLRPSYDEAHSAGQCHYFSAAELFQAIHCQLKITPFTRKSRDPDSLASMLLEYPSTPKNSAAIFLTDLLHCFYGLHCFFALGCAAILDFVCLHLLSRAHFVLLSLRQGPVALHVRGNRSWSFVDVVVY